jgi:Skp family chaperone for outer membrane proteins
MTGRSGLVLIENAAVCGTYMQEKLMSGRVWLMAAVTGVVLGLGSVVKAEEQRLAVVRLEDLMKAHPETTPAEALLDKERDDFETERREMLDERDRRKALFDAARDDAENPALSDEARTEKLKDLEAKYKAVREYEREIQDTQAQRQRELNDHGRRLRERIVEQIQKVVKSYAAKEGYTLVLNSENAGMNAFGTVMYNSESLDITDAVRERMLEEYKKSGGVKDASPTAAP